MKSNKGMHIGLVVSDLTKPHWVIMSKAAGEKAAELGLELSAVSPSREVAEEQIPLIEDFVKQKVDAFIIAAVDSQGIVPAVEKANQAGIPVIAVDVRIWGGQVACTVQTDNIEGTQLAAEYIVQRLGGKGKVINLQGNLSSQAGYHRSQGLHEVLAKYPQIEVVFEEETYWRSDRARELTTQALQAHPDADALFAANDTALLGALEAVKGAGLLGQLVLVGFDAIPQILTLIHKGEVDASVQQFPARMGATAVEMAAKILRGEDVPEWVDTGVALITRENAMEAAMEGLETMTKFIQDLVEERDRLEKLQKEIIDTQRQALRELSTPIVPVLEGVLVLPLVGSIDTGRAQQVMETLLDAVGGHQAEVVIIDVTGVPVVDTGVANHLLQVTRAAALLGAECVLVGISPDVAQTIVSLGVDLSGITTKADLQAGIEHALETAGKKIVPL